MQSLICVYLFSPPSCIKALWTSLCFCLPVFIVSGLVSIIGGISLTSWNSWYFSPVWFCYWSLVNRGQTLLEQEWIPLFAYEWVFVQTLILSIYANANSYMWRGVEKGTKNQNQNKAGFMEMLVFHHLSSSLHLFYCTGFQKWPTSCARVFLV